MLRIARGLLTIFLVCAAVAAAPAAEILPIRPGMSFDEITRQLQPLCQNLHASGKAVGGEPKIVSCSLTEANPPSIINVMISKKDRAWYIGWSTPIPDPDPIEGAKAIAPKLGFTGEPQQCDRDGKKVPCWQAADGTVLYVGAWDDQFRRLAFSLQNDGILFEDTH